MNVAKTEQLINELPSKYPTLSLSHRYAATTMTQLIELCNKFFVSYWRSPSYNFVRMMITIIVSIIFGTVYFDVGNIKNGENAVVEIKNIQNFIGVLFTGMGFMGMMNLGAVLPVVAEERAVFYHERNRMMYSSFSYALASGVVELPYLLLQVPIFYYLFLFKNKNKNYLRQFYLCLLCTS